MLRHTVDFLLQLWQRRSEAAPLDRFAFISDRLRAVMQDISVQARYLVITPSFAPSVGSSRRAIMSGDPYLTSPHRVLPYLTSPDRTLPVRAFLCLSVCLSVLTLPLVSATQRLASSLTLTLTPTLTPTLTSGWRRLRLSCSVASPASTPLWS